MRFLVLATIFISFGCTFGSSPTADRLNIQTLDLASQLANMNRDFKRSKVDIDNFIKDSLSAKPAKSEDNLKITQIDDVRDERYEDNTFSEDFSDNFSDSFSDENFPRFKKAKVESPFSMQDAEVDRIGEGSGLGTDNNVFKPESDDEDDYDYEEEEEEQNQAVEEKVEKLVLLITEAPEIQPEETTKNQEFYDYIEQNYPEESLETENEDYSRPASENDIPLETVTGEPEEDNNVDNDEAAEAPENEAIDEEKRVKITEIEADLVVSEEKELEDYEESEDYDESYDDIDDVIAENGENQENGGNQFEILNTGAPDVDLEKVGIEVEGEIEDEIGEKLENEIENEIKEVIETVVEPEYGLNETPRSDSIKPTERIEIPVVEEVTYTATFFKTEEIKDTISAPVKPSETISVPIEPIAAEGPLIKFAIEDYVEKLTVKTSPDMMIIFFACVCLLTMLVTIVGYMFYRLRKRDEGSYQVGIKA